MSGRLGMSVLTYLLELRTTLAGDHTAVLVPIGLVIGLHTFALGSDGSCQVKVRTCFTIARCIELCFSVSPFQFHHLRMIHLLVRRVF